MAKNAAQHLHEIHKAAHAHHERMADAHKAALAALEKTSATDPHVAFHKAGLFSHEKMAASHFAAMQETEKAATDAMNKADQVQPSPVSRVTPDVPNLRAVPRIGSAPIQKPNVPQAFEKVFAIEDEETDLRGGPAL